MSNILSLSKAARRRPASERKGGGAEPYPVRPDQVREAAGKGREGTGGAADRCAPARRRAAMAEARAGIVKRSIMIAGHRTSISLEQPFWDELKRLAGERGLSAAALIAEIDQGRSVRTCRPPSGSAFSQKRWRVEACSGRSRLGRRSAGCGAAAGAVSGRGERRISSIRCCRAWRRAASSSARRCASWARRSASARRRSSSCRRRSSASARSRASSSALRAASSARRSASRRRRSSSCRRRSSSCARNRASSRPCGRLLRATIGLDAATLFLLPATLLFLRTQPGLFLGLARRLLAPLLLFLSTALLLRGAKATVEEAPLALVLLQDLDALLLALDGDRSQAVGEWTDIDRPGRAHQGPRSTTSAAAGGRSSPSAYHARTAKPARRLWQCENRRRPRRSPPLRRRSVWGRP